MYTYIYIDVYIYKLYMQHLCWHSFTFFLSGVFVISHTLNVDRSANPLASTIGDEKASASETRFRT